MKRAKRKVILLRKLRRDREMSQHELAQHVGLDMSAISLIERGLRNPSFPVARKIAEFFGVPIEDVFGYVDVQPIVSPKKRQARTAA